jgi:hypothetical protein
MKRRALTPSEIAAFWPGLSDPDAKIAECIAGFEETGNPFYAWLATEICIAAKRQFPAQILDYLRQCAVRMRSLQARGPEGVREILRWVLGFPVKDKSGPGNMLDPDQGRPQLCFVLQFSDYVCRGDNPAKALSKAHDVLDTKIADKVSDPTLRDWVKKHYDLKAWPRRIDEWREIISQYYPGEELAIRLHTALHYYKNTAENLPRVIPPLPRK